MKSNNIKHQGDFHFLNCLHSFRIENNPESSSTTKIGEHISYGFPMSTILEFDHIKSKHTVYRGKDCTKCFFGSLKENAKNITDLEKKKTLLLTKKE